ncbi:ER lumen retaining receptor protein [Perkinsela sp. CCAP 1560/4]|nr:ER lumen retaining receptor protein [Perkinsela sp. CCAP 1560/4]KNH05053.1 ER lumen retaining receptor protein [Perkinsela sp. CCAP 1560/4]|eukprot:KNH03668.1 ER lumen retaining receptor protein [Perkinsela sp. CCAP 1560/4]
MNGFRLIGDMLHLLAIFILLTKMIRFRTAAGISLKTQFLYAVVFTARYTDLFTSFVSYYNSLMKIVYILTSYHICYLMHCRFPWNVTYDKSSDSFGLKYPIIGCFVLALMFHRHARHEWQEILWTFSEYLEAIAIIPQIYMLENTEKYEALTSHYIFALGAYRVFYVLNWVYRYFAQGYVSVVSWIAGGIQTALYVDFFYQYMRQVVHRTTKNYNLG